MIFPLFYSFEGQSKKGTELQPAHWFFQMLTAKSGARDSYGCQEPKHLVHPRFCTIKKLESGFRQEPNSDTPLRDWEGLATKLNTGPRTRYSKAVCSYPRWKKKHTHTEEETPFV